MPDRPDLARPLASVRGGDRLAVGGKAAALGELTAAGIAVPPGFAVTTAAYTHAMADLDSDGTIAQRIGRLDPADTAGIATACAAARERILAAELPTEVVDAITASYRELGGEFRAMGSGGIPRRQHGAPPGGQVGGQAGPVPVAVRSSATSEDSESASFAGLQDTYLWVQGEDEVLAHVRHCWASLYSVESVTYRRHQDVPEHGLAMGVVVQVMVEPRCAGVLFTRSPVTGDPSVTVVEASWGLGSALVGGDVTPDSYVASKVTGEIVKRTVATKLRQCERDPAGGVRLVDVPAELRDAPCLDDAQIRALAGLGRQVAEHYGTPQDIEWAMTADGRFVVLQSRPETVWSHRATTPVAVPKARAFDHVLDRLASGARGTAR